MFLNTPVLPSPPSRFRTLLSTPVTHDILYRRFELIVCHINPDFTGYLSVRTASKLFSRPPYSSSPPQKASAPHKLCSRLLHLHQTGPIYFPSFIQTEKSSICVPYHPFEFVEKQNRLKSLNLPYGEVTAGKLMVTTASRDATLNPLRSPVISFNAAANLGLHDVKIIPPLDDSELRQTAQGNSDTAEDIPIRPVRCLAISLSNRRDSPRIGGLMLVEWSGQNGVFRRMDMIIQRCSFCV